MTNKQTGVLRKPDEAELQTLIDLATADYIDNVDGFDEFLRTDEKTGRAIGGFRKGSYIRLQVPSGDSILTMALENLAKGYEVHPEGTLQSVGVMWTVALYKPQAERDEDLRVIREQVTAAYEATIKAENDAVIAKVVAQRIAEEERKDAAAVAKHRGTRHAAIENEVLSALSGAKQ